MTPLEDNKPTTLHWIADYLEQIGVSDVDKLEVYVYPKSRSVHLQVSASELEHYTPETEEHQQVRAVIQLVKRICGPLKAQGDPPYISLKGKRKFPIWGDVEKPLMIEGTVYGYFNCKIKGYEHVTVPAEPARTIPAKPETVEKKPVYDCEPIDLNGIVESL